MKKVATIFMVLTLLVSFVWAENANQAIKRVQWSREMAKFSRSEQVQVIAKDQNRVQFKNDREEVMRNQIGRTHRYKTAHQVQSKLQVLKDIGGFQPAQTSQVKFAPKSANSFEFLDTLAMAPYVADTVYYLAGDSFVFQIFSMDTVILEFWVDNGDSVFGYDDFMIKMEMDGNEEAIKVWDGVEFDESPPGDGVFQVTLNTSNFNNDGPEPYFGLQNCIVYVNARNIYATEEFTGVAFVGAPDENTSIEGTVTVADTLGPAANMIVWAAKMPADTMWEWEPEVAFLTMTDEYGHYRIEIPDMWRGDFVIGVADIWGLYPGYFPDHPEIDMFISGDIYPVDFMLIEGKETIYGAVQDENGNGVSGIRIGAWGPYGDVEVVTEFDGLFSIPAMPGWWEVDIEDDDIYGQYMLTWGQGLEVFENGDHPVYFTLYSLDATFTGNVGTTTGMPLMDVEVFTDIWMGMDGGYFNWTHTDEFGNYELWVSTALQGIVMWDSSGWVDTSSYWIGAWIEGAIIAPNGYHNMYAPAADLDFTVSISDAMLSGIVYDAVNQNPLHDAGVRAWMPGPDSGKGPDGYMPMFEYWAHTDERGYYELPLIGGSPPDGNTWFIEVFWPWEWMPSIVDSLNAVSGNNYTRDYYISPPVKDGFIEGYVFNKDGNGISNARVEIYGPNYYEVYTDGRGYFSVSQVPFGWYSFTAYADGYDPYNIYDIWVDQYPVYLEFWMGSIVGDIKVNGYVVDQESNPISGALMMLFNWDYYEPFTLFTGDSGNFEINVKPGWYDIQVGANGFGAVGQNVDIHGDTTIIFMLNSIVIPDTLVGNVVDNSGYPLRKVFVYMEKYNNNDGMVEYMGYTYSDINGQYKLALPSGEINAMYSKNDFNPEWRWFDFPGSVPEDPIVLYPSVHVFGPELMEVMDIPEDHGKQVRLTWKRAEGLQGSVKEYQIWRAIEPFNGPEPSPEMGYGWDYVTTVPVRPEMEIYNVVVPTLYDAVGDNIYWTGFVVTAIGWDSWSYWNSNMRAGFSVDNLPPEVPVGLNAVGDGVNITLQWEPVTSEKVKYYSIYRKTASTTFEIIGYSITADYLDESVSTSETYEYAVTATDFGLNESGKSSPVSAVALAIEETVIPTEFALKPNYPNPFNPETTIEFALPKTSKVTLTIYNLMGQLIQELVNSEYSAGYQRVVWNGQDSRGNMVGSGVYIYSLKTDNFSQTRKMILMR